MRTVVVGRVGFGMVGRRERRHLVPVSGILEEKQFHFVGNLARAVSLVC